MPSRVGPPVDALQNPGRCGPVNRRFLHWSRFLIPYSPKAVNSRKKGIGDVGCKCKELTSSGGSTGVVTGFGADGGGFFGLTFGSQSSRLLKPDRKVLQHIWSRAWFDNDARRDRPRRDGCKQTWEGSENGLCKNTVGKSAEGESATDGRSRVISSVIHPKPSQGRPFLRWLQRKGFKKRTKGGFRKLRSS